MATVTLASTALVLSGCAESQREGDGSGGESSTFVFAGSAEPVVLDPFFASDGESFRISRQIFEGLTTTAPGTAETAPSLATEWTTSEDGLTYQFTLQEGVKYHDGTDFNAESVCWNFDRWYNMPEGIAQSPDTSYYYLSLFKGFATGPTAGKGIYDSCTVDGEFQATVKLTKPFAGFIAAMSLPAFAMQSQAAHEKYDSPPGQDPRKSEYSTAHPTGTGPFVFESWERGQRVTLQANPDYWGEKAKVDTAIVVAIEDPKARATALREGEIDGFDLVGPADIESLRQDGFKILNRPAFNILYLGMNQKAPQLDNPQVRQAIAHAIDKEEVARVSLPEGTKIATQFVPQLVNGWNPDVKTYDHDPERARQLLEDAGAAGMTLEFNYPTGVSRPYMPDPEATYNIIRSQLEAVGIKIKPTPDAWTPDYLEKIQGTSNHGIHLLGWTGDYNDTDNFLGVFFGQESNEWGFDRPQLFEALAEARTIPTPEEQTPFYEQINADVMEFLPGVPLAHPVPSLAFAEYVSGYEPSPVGGEIWNTVELSRN